MPAAMPPSLFPPLYQIAAVAALLLLVRPAFAINGIEALLHGIHWGEASDALIGQLGGAAERLPQAFDFGDSYADIVVKGVAIGGVPVVAFYQMSKATHGLKRVQLEPVGHQINPPAYRAIAAALDAQYGRPDQICVTPPTLATGFQASVEERWVHGDDAVSAIFRDTTLEAFEGCLYGPATGWCGLHGQLLVRIAPPASADEPCMAAVHPEPAG